MKRLILLVLMFLVTFTSQSLAYFESGNLIQFVWTTGTTGSERVTDLGSTYRLQSAYTGEPITYTPATGTSLLDLKTNGYPWQNINVAYLIYDGEGTGLQFWTSGNLTGQTTTQPGYVAANTIGYQYVNSGIIGKTVSTYYQNTSKSNSYQHLFGTSGTWNGAVSGGADISLSVFNDPDVTFVDQILYTYAFYDNPDAGLEGIPIYDIRTFADGHIELLPINQSNPSATPLPSSVLLFGSGLVGYVGIRRRFEK